MESVKLPLAIGGYVLAGGKSSRMGRDKALLELAGKPLVEHAVIKLRRLCADTKILGSSARLATYAPLIPDVHAGCGPLGGIEAALLDTQHDWNLFLAVDLPFVTTGYLADWAHCMLRPRNAVERALTFWKSDPVQDLRMAWVSSDDDPLLLLLLHREIVPLITRALDTNRYGLFETLRVIGEQIAVTRGLKTDAVIWNQQCDEYFGSASQGLTEPWAKATESQRDAQRQMGFDMFANVNTPTDLARAEMFVDALDC